MTIWNEGDRGKCISSASPGYKVGETYSISKNDKGTLGFTGRDGFFDPVNMLVSRFQKVEPVADK